MSTSQNFAPLARYLGTKQMHAKGKWCLPSMSAILPKNVAGKTGTQGSEHDQNIAGSSGQQAQDGQNIDCNSSQPTIEQNCSLETANTRSDPNGQNVSESGQAESTSQNNAQ